MSTISHSIQHPNPTTKYRAKIIPQRIVLDNLFSLFFSPDNAQYPDPARMVETSTLKSALYIIAAYETVKGGTPEAVKAVTTYGATAIGIRLADLFQGSASLLEMSMVLEAFQTIKDVAPVFVEKGVYSSFIDRCWRSLKDPELATQKSREGVASEAHMCISVLIR